jgi:hypothetical protein
MKEIHLTRGQVALVDDEDYEALSLFSWHATPQSNRNQSSYYAVRTTSRLDGKQRRIFMHREIMAPPLLVMVDHINGNGLDNRRANLRFATYGQNRANIRVVRAASGFKGVEQRNGHFRAVFEKVTLGYFDTATEAALAYDKAATERFGEYAATNASLGLIVSPAINQ